MRFFALIRYIQRFCRGIPHDATTEIKISVTMPLDSFGVDFLALRRTLCSDLLAY